MADHSIQIDPDQFKKMLAEAGCASKPAYNAVI
jgi:hypothetical protein